MSKNQGKQAKKNKKQQQKFQEDELIINGHMTVFPDPKTEKYIREAYKKQNNNSSDNLIEQQIQNPKLNFKDRKRLQQQIQLQQEQIGPKQLQSKKGQNHKNGQQQKQQSNQQKHSNGKSNNNKKQNQLQNKKNKKQDNKDNKGIEYKNYLSPEEVEQGLKDKTLYKGLFIALERSTNFAQIKSESFNKRLCVSSQVEQNRALHQQIVVFKLKQKQKPKEKNQKPNNEKKKKNNKQQNELFSDSQSGGEEEVQDILDTLTLDQPIKEKQNIKPKSSQDEDEEEEEEEEGDYEQLEEESDEQTNGTKLEQQTIVQEEKKEEDEENKEATQGSDENTGSRAEIVAIYENPYLNKNIVGQVQYSKKGNLMFQPIDKRLPKMLISEQSKEIQAQFLQGSDKETIDTDQFQNKYFKAKYLNWEPQYYQPFVRLETLIGNTGEIEVECQALLQENDVYQEDFSEKCFEYLDKFEDQLDSNREFIISDDERQKRLDLTQEIICTIDPATARDLDDALSIKKLENGNYQIGVHIADVGHFVDDNTILDEEARLRTTSVYLPHRVIPMLPRLLCENLCSLNPGVERLAFSCFFEMKEDGEILENTAQFAKSIIKSCVKFSYDVVQEMIEGKIQTVEDLPDQYKPVGVDPQKLFEEVMLIQQLGMTRRRSRQKTVPFQIEKIKRRFQTNEVGWPVSFQIEQRKEANFVVEEFMLLANKLVGKKLVESCRELAVLRNHSFPKDNKITFFKNLLVKLGNYKFNFDSCEDIQASFNEINKSTSIKPEHKQMVQFKMIKMLEAAQYFVVQDQPEEFWKHFALNFDVYTHFTSPIRRYPDILVHRLLNLVLNLRKDQNINDLISQKEMIAIMDKCNSCKQASRKIQDGCDKIFTCLYLKDNQLFTKAIVSSYGSKTMTLIIPDYNIEKDFTFSDCKDLVSIDQILKVLVLTCKINKKNENRETRQLTITPFKEIDIRLTATNQFPIDYQINLCVRNSINNELIVLN